VKVRYVTTIADLRRTDIDEAGGKAANLGELIRTGFQVPPGFCILTSAYKAFVSANGAESRIRDALRVVRAGDAASLQDASDAVRAAFRAGIVSEDLISAVSEAYTALGGAVAVRSSATAEDLPDLSFAGQQDTYLNVVGIDALLNAVVDCWASLWTARAIGYRAAHGISQDGISLAVVVQRMVESDASGVLFTANPLTGTRTQTVIDATVGIGEALVSGKIEPDHFVVQDGRIIGRSLGAKAVSVRCVDGGGTRLVAETVKDRQALPDDAVLELVRMGRKVEDGFGLPQDIEWARAGSKLFLLQSRPITSLYPLPCQAPDGRLLALFSFGAWQGMLDPFSPLGADAFRLMMVSFAGLFGMTVTVESETALIEAGSRLFLNLTSLFDHPVGRRFLAVYADSLDPGSMPAMRTLFDDPRLSPSRARIRVRTLRGFLRIARKLVPTVVFNMISPVRGRRRLQAALEEFARGVRERYAGATTLSCRLSVLQTILARLPPLFSKWLVPSVASGQAPMLILARLCAAVPDGAMSLLELTRGLPHNVTTEMDLFLWRMSRAIAADPSAAERTRDATAESLARDFMNDSLPRAAQKAVSRFLERYGTRGVAEIDMGRPRWNEDPTPLFLALKSYLLIEERERSPETVFERGRSSARDAALRLLARLKEGRGGRLKAFIARGLIRRLRELGGMREGPKLAAVRSLSAGREAFLASGRDLVSGGVLAAADDIFFLRIAELRALAAGREIACKSLVQERRKTWERERQRRLVPRVMLSDGTAFYGGVARREAGEDGETIRGSPVSPGVAEGIVRVILDPFSARIEPGEILVCPATDPAWTPLFLPAAGLVMEMGGMMTHGSVVAREYGIPAIVGVSDATTRLKTGERIRLDGSAGEIHRLDRRSS
jgi:phosphohistidine swiveling domain-containing protein